MAFCGYLAAVFLCLEAVRRNEPALAEQFRRRALVTAVVSGALAAAGIPLLASASPTLTGQLLHQALPLVALSVAGGAASIATLLRRRYGLARVAATAAVSGVVAGWGVAQYPVLVAPGLTVSAAAAPASTLPVTLLVLVAGFAVTVPPLVLLFRTFGAGLPGRGAGRARISYPPR